MRGLARCRADSRRQRRKLENMPAAEVAAHIAAVERQAAADLALARSLAGLGDVDVCQRDVAASGGSKELRKLRKKLRNIALLERKLEAGSPLNDEQRRKLATKENVCDAIARRMETSHRAEVLAEAFSSEDAAIALEIAAAEAARRVHPRLAAPSTANDAAIAMAMQRALNGEGDATSSSASSARRHRGTGESRGGSSPATAAAASAAAARASHARSPRAIVALRAAADDAALRMVEHKRRAGQVHGAKRSVSGGDHFAQLGASCHARIISERGDAPRARMRALHYEAARAEFVAHNAGTFDAPLPSAAAIRAVRAPRRFALDLHGLRCAEACRVVKLALEALSLARPASAGGGAFATLVIVHGNGTGALREGVRAYVRKQRGARVESQARDTLAVVV